MVVEHGGKILRHALHAPRADRFDARLLYCLEHGAALLAAGNELAMNGGVVTGHPQRDRIGMAAHNRGVFPVQLARRLRQPRLAAGEAGPLGRKRNLKLRLARDARAGSRSPRA